MRYLELIDDKSAKGLELGCVSAIDSKGLTIWIADAHRDEGKRFVVHADDKLTAFVEPESAIRAGSVAHPKSHRSSFVVRVTTINDRADVF